MKLHSARRIILVLVACTWLSLGPRLRAQEIDEQSQKTELDRTHDDEKILHGVPSAILGNREGLTDLDFTTRHQRRIYEVEFQAGDVYAITGPGVIAGGPFHISQPMQFSRGDLIVYRGVDSSSGQKYKIDTRFNFAIASSRSANDSFALRAEAAMLGDEVPDLKNTIVFNALPYEAAASRSRVELRRMRLVTPSSANWQQLQHSIRSASGGLSVVTAERATVLHELASGSHNVILILAHGYENRVFMPGAHGGMIDATDLARMLRQQAPNRIVIIISCYAGKVNEAHISLSEIMLAKKLARTVFASDSVLDGTYIPKVLQNLQAKMSWRSSLLPLKDLQQRVEVAPPPLRVSEEPIVAFTTSTHESSEPFDLASFRGAHTASEMCSRP